ncbi:MAG: protein-L-isoaspartate O-methyltransferase [Pseudomonadota bacterium]
MGDFSKARVQMVDNQIRPNDITDLGLIETFLNVPRELFVPQGKKAIAYSDADIALSATDSDKDRYLFQPVTYAKLLDAAKIGHNDVVLCIGSGSGYGVALMASLADSVVGIDQSEQLVEQANEALAALEIDNVAVLNSDHKAGNAKEAPFDVILIEGAVEEAPLALCDQLRDGGRLVTILGTGLSAHVVVITKKGEDISHVRRGNISAALLPGFEKEAGFVF